MRDKTKNYTSVCMLELKLFCLNAMSILCELSVWIAREAMTNQIRHIKHADLYNQDLLPKTYLTYTVYMNTTCLLLKLCCPTCSHHALLVTAQHGTAWHRAAQHSKGASVGVKLRLAAEPPLGPPDGLAGLEMLQLGTDTDLCVLGHGNAGR